MFVLLGYPKRAVPAIPWAGPLSKSRSVSSPALSSLRLPVQQGTRTSAPCGECWVGLAAATPAAGFTMQRYCLASCVSFILGNFPILWATKISLEMQLQLTSPRIQRELPSVHFLTRILLVKIDHSSHCCFSVPLREFEVIPLALTSSCQVFPCSTCHTFLASL